MILTDSMLVSLLTLLCYCSPALYTGCKVRLRINFRKKSETKIFAIRSGETAKMDLLKKVLGFIQPAWQLPAE